MVSIQGVDRDLPRKAPHPASLCIHPRHAEADAGQGEFYTLLYTWTWNMQVCMK